MKICTLTENQGQKIVTLKINNKGLLQELPLFV